MGGEREVTENDFLNGIERAVTIHTASDDGEGGGREEEWAEEGVLDGGLFERQINQRAELSNAKFTRSPLQ